MQDILIIAGSWVVGDLEHSYGQMKGIPCWPRGGAEGSLDWGEKMRGKHGRSTEGANQMNKSVIRKFLLISPLFLYVSFKNTIAIYPVPTCTNLSCRYRLSQGLEGVNLS